jgi:peptidoglycan/LPS O-acetylase OafA/YrhL
VKRIPQLDGIRGLAILLVLLWHYGACEFVAPSWHPLWILSTAFRLTWSGVDLFFVLSGFLIAGILLDHRHSGNYFRIFYLRRFCRIVPLYAVVVIAFLLVRRTSIGASPAFAWLFANPMPTWSYATFTQNFVMAARGTLGANFLDPTWSLAVEEQFYLCIPFLIYFLPRRALMVVLSIAIAAAPLLRWFAPGVQAFVGTPWRSDSLLSGALLAVLVRSHSLVDLARRHSRRLIIAFVILLIGAAGLTIHPPLLQGDAFTHLWLAALYSCLVLLAFLEATPWLTKSLRWPVMVWLGQLSYGIYLLHKPVVGAIYGMWRGTTPIISTANDAMLTLLALGLTLLLATISFRLFESPLIRWGHKFHYSPGAQGAVVRSRL